jgi:LysR family transcriptional regulator, nitrogen assimilation regulatory protein
MDLRTLRYFVQIAEQRSFTKAAHRLHVAQPSLTRQIHKLEEELAVSLFVRLSRGVALTEAGELLLDHATRLLRDVERTQSALREHGATPSGPVLLGLPPTLGPVLLPQLITRLRRHYPKVVLEVVPSRNLTLADWLLTGRVDVALMAQTDPQPELVVSEIAREEMVVVSGPGMRKEGVVAAEELGELPLIGTASLFAITNNLLKRHGVRLHVDLVLNNLDAVRTMVQQSLCYSVFPYAIIRADHEAGRLMAHRILASGLHRRLVIGISAHRPQTAAMQAVIHLCRAIMAEVEAAKGFALRSAGEPVRRSRGVASRGDRPVAPDVAVTAGFSADMP